MKTVILYVISIMVLMSIVAYLIQPGEVESGKVKLTWTSDDNPARREQFALFNKLYPRYQMQLDPSNSTAEKVIVQSLAGVGPDLFDSYQLSSFVKSGIAWDITDELLKKGINIQKDCWDVVLPGAVYNGRVYGFPSNIGNSAIWFNKDIFDRYGISYPKGPWKWSDFLPLAQRLTIRDKNGRIKQFGFLADWGLWPNLVLQWGGHRYSSDGTRCTLDSPEAIGGVQFLQDLVYKYHVMPNPNDEQASTQGGWGSGCTSLFASGKGAMAFGGRYWLCLMRTMNTSRLGAVECPYERVRVVLGGGRITIINKNSPRRNDALNYLVYLAGKEYNELVNHQADGLGPMKSLAFTDLYLHDPEYPNEDFNDVWRDTMKYTVAPEESPFVSRDIADRIVAKQIDLVKNNQKSAADAMKTAAKKVNDEIRKNLERDPKLRAQYEELTRRKN